VHHAVTLEADAEAIPESLEVDLSGLALGDSIHLSSVKLPVGTSSALHGDDTLATIVAPSGLKEAQAEDAAAAAKA
jgi:large subunit ribosomal protein L25